MKPSINFLHRLSTAALLCCVATALTACTADPIVQPEGSLPTVSGTRGTLISTIKNASGEIELSFQYDESKTVGNEISDAIAWALPAATDKPITVRLRIDTSLVTSYNDLHLFENIWDTDNDRWKTYQRYRPAYPEDVSLSSELLTIETGKMQSATLPITFNFDATRDALSSQGPLRKLDKWLCPIVAEELSDGLPTGRSQILWYKITLTKDISHWYKSVGERQADYGAKNTRFIIYCNTDRFSPTLANKLGGAATDWATFESGEEYYLCDVLNLETATVIYNAKQQRAVLSLTSDLRYVFDHREKYIVPVQTVGTKVCITIQGGGGGIGFCNLNDEQRADLISQIKGVVTRYHLDGVNLWDKEVGYGAEGTPAIDPTSYPKFIKALREALGQNKQITLVDDGVSTSNFDQAVAGIEVGRLVDLAWTGTLYVPTDPWSSGDTNRLQRKPIAGLVPNQWVSMMFDWSDENPQQDEEKWGPMDPVAGWTSWIPIARKAFETTSNCVVGYGMIASIHGTSHEGEPGTSISNKAISDVCSDLDLVNFESGTTWSPQYTSNLVLNDRNGNMHSDGMKDW